MQKRFIIGSTAFFSGINDFRSKDIDVLIVDDNPQGYKTFRQTHLKKGKCVFEWKDMNADEFIDYTLEHYDTPMQIGKFLVPDFAGYLGLTIEQLKRLQPLVDKLDDAHKYEGIIYNAYLVNGSFTLTQEQLSDAYECYKLTRQNTDK